MTSGANESVWLPCLQNFPAPLLLAAADLPPPRADRWPPVQAEGTQQPPSPFPGSLGFLCSSCLTSGGYLALILKISLPPCVLG